MSAYRFSISLLLGALLGLSNLFIALQTGFTVGVAILTVFCWAGAEALCTRLGARWAPLEHADYACHLSLTSAMSYGCGTVIATALAALLMSENQTPSPFLLTLWVMGICASGTCLAWPLRSRMLADLAFPSGKVAAATVENLRDAHSLKPFFLGLAGTWGFVVLRDVAHLLPARFPLWTKTFYLHCSPMFLGLGAILGLPTCGAMFLGGCCFFLLGPLLFQAGNYSEHSLWFAISMMVCAGVPDFLVSLWKIRVTDNSGPEPLAGSLTWLTCSVLSLILLAVVHLAGFGTQAFLLPLMFLLMWLFAVVACRVTGETDVVPVGALGKLSLLVLGLLLPGKAQATMAATGSLTGGAAASADFMNDLRCGQQLGCAPQRQFRYQFAGAVIGPLLFVPLFLYLVSGQHPLGGATFPAPAAKIWLNVARLADDASQSLLATQAGPIAAGGICGLVLFALRRYRNRLHLPYVPAPVAFAMAAILDWPVVATLFLGALLGAWLQGEKSFKIWCALIAAESVAAVLILLF